MRGFLRTFLVAALATAFILFANFMITTCGIAGWFAVGVTLLAIIDITRGGAW